MKGNPIKITFGVPKTTLLALCSALVLSACATAPGGAETGADGGTAPPQAAAAPAKATPVPDLLRMADELLDAELYEDAGKRYGQVLSLDPGNPQARMGLAEVRLAAGNLDKARADFIELAEIEALRPRALQGRGLALLKLGRRAEAGKALAEAVEADPTLWRTWNALGRLHDAKERWEEADRCYREALKAAPEAAPVHNNLGYSLMRQGRAKEAAEAFVRALEIDPGLTVAAANLRLALAADGRYVEAMAGARPEEMPEILNNLGYLAMNRGDYDAAETYLTRSLAVSPSYFDQAAKNMLRLKALRGEEPKLAAKE